MLLWCYLLKTGQLSELVIWSADSILQQQWTTDLVCAAESVDLGLRVLVVWVVQFGLSLLFYRLFGLGP